MYLTKQFSTDILLKSLNKAVKIARRQGTFNIKEIAFVDTIIAVIDNSCMALITPEEYQQLVSLYFRMLNNHQGLFYRYCVMNQVAIPKLTEEMAKPIEKRVYYWQQPDPADTNAMVQALITPEFLSQQSYRNLDVMRDGYEIRYGKIGRIAFYATDTVNANQYDIINILGVSVINSFDKTYIPELKGTLYVSKNAYVPSSIFSRFKYA